MSERILKALMQLFAIVAAPGGNAENNPIVENFLRLELSDELVSEYLKLYQEYYENLTKRKSDSKKVVSASSVKILKICTAIKEELTQKQRVVVYFRLLEFIGFTISEDEDISEQELDFVTTVAQSFNIDEEEYTAIRQFVINPTGIIPEIENLLIVDNDINFKHPILKHIYSEFIQDKIMFFYVKSVNLYFFLFKYEKELLMNSQMLSPNRIYVFSPGSSIRNSKIKPIYYSDVVSGYNVDGSRSKIFFEVNNLEYHFKNGKIGLHKMSFFERSGKLIGIMGSSGAGKTTLLNTLIGNLKPSSGEVLINGINVYDNNHELDGLIGYVAQDDLLIEELTVFQNLYYSARQCFDNLNRVQIYRIVLKMLRTLGLYDIRNLKVGSPLNKRISGGQRKRLNIALELIREPQILFLDEPTSGLSSRDSENILDLLKELTLRGKLVFVVIHQPSSEIFKLFDRLILLDTGGYLIYNGDPVESISYFKQSINMASSTEAECPTCGNVNPEQIFNIVESQIVDEYGATTQTRKITPQEWHNRFLNQKNKEKRRSHLVKSLPEINFKIPNFFKQFLIFIKRDILSKFSNQQYMMINLLESPLLAILMSYIIKYRSIAAENSNGYTLLDNTNLPVYLFMAVIVALFVGISVSAQEIIKDRKILKREAFLNLNRNAYLMSKIIILLFMSAFQAFCFIIIGNTILEIPCMYFKYWLILFSVWVNANIVGLNISDGFKETVTIYILIPFLIIPQIVLSGVLVSFDKLNPTISKPGEIPLYGDIFTARWAYEALAVEQFVNNKYEKPLYQFEKIAQNAQIKQDFILTMLENKVLDYERNKNDESKKEKLISDFKTIQNEIKIELKQNPKLKLEFNLENIDYNKVTNEDIVALKQYFSNLKAYYRQQYKIASKQKDDYVASMQKTESDKQNYLKLKYSNHNESLSDFVTNNKETSRVLEYNNRIYRKADPIYFDPESKFLRAHFYAPRKNLFGLYIDTFWANLLVIWIQSFGLYICLKYRVLKRILDRLSELDFKYNSKKEKQIIEKSKHKKKGFENWKIFR